MLQNLYNLFVGFFRASNFGFGGGPALIPLIQVEVVNRFHWMTNAQFADAVAASNALPGLVGAKIPGYVGYQAAGWPGAIIAMIAAIAPTILIIIILSRYLMKLANSPKLKAMLMGVRPVVVVLIAQTSLQMGMTSVNSLRTWLIALGTIALLYFTKLHPALLIVASMIIGLLIFK